MAFEFPGMTKFIARCAAIAVIAFGASACSVMPEWLGGDSNTGNTAQDQSDEQMAANQSSPDLNGVPEKPTAPSTADDQKNLSDSLGADRAQNQYSSDQLRGGTEAAAPPPGAPAPAPADQTAADASQPAPAAAPPPADQTASNTAPPPSAAPAPDTSSSSDSTDTSAPPAPVPSAPADTMADNSAPTPAVAPAPPPSAPAPQRQTAMNSAPPAMTPSTGPAVPAGSYGTYGASMVSPSDAALGFKPSQAPPLSPTVAQFVPQPILSRYQQTAAMGRASYSTTSEGAYSASPVSNGTRAMGGPEHMSGAVVANFDSLNTGVAAMPGMYGQPSAVVMFAGDRTILNASARDQVRAAAAAFQQTGGQGFIRVVGHAADSGNLSSERHQVINFEHSHARATAVARELIRDGVPADKVLVETGAGAEAGASAEIFLQS